MAQQLHEHLLVIAARAGIAGKVISICEVALAHVSARMKFKRSRESCMQGEAGLGALGHSKVMAIEEARCAEALSLETLSELEESRV